MSLANCSSCGRLFNRTLRDICPDCVKEEDRIFGLVKEYLNDHPLATLTEVAQGVGVPEEQVLRLMKSGRVLATPGFSYPCESCGAPIREGQFCARCAEELKLSMKEAAQELKKPKPGSAYYSQNRTR